MLPYKFWLICMGMKQKNIFWKKSGIGGLKSTNFPFCILEHFLKKFKAFKYEKIEVKGMDVPILI